MKTARNDAQGGVGDFGRKLKSRTFYACRTGSWSGVGGLFKFLTLVGRFLNFLLDMADMRFGGWHQWMNDDRQWRRGCLD